MNKLIAFVAATTLLGILFVQAAAASEPAEIFKSLDADANGFLTPEEVLSNDDLATSFEDGDKNDDGMLDMAEFEKMEVRDE